VDSIGDRQYFQHGGANEGFRCQYYGSLSGGDGVAIMVNSDEDAILREVINSVATVYEWKNFFKPQIKKLAAVPTDTLDLYTGNYVAPNQPELIIDRKGTDLYLTMPDGNIMRLYFTSLTDFFLMDLPIPVKFVRNEKDGKYMILAKGRDRDMQFTRK
jgi:hypothetical protein